MIRNKFPSLELCNYGVVLPGRDKERLFTPKSEPPEFQKRLQDLGYNLDKEVRIYQPDRYSHEFDDTWTLEQR